MALGSRIGTWPSQQGGRTSRVQCCSLPRPGLVGRRKRCPMKTVVAAGNSQQLLVTDKIVETARVCLPANDVLQNVQLVVVPDGRGQAIVVSEVVQGSPAEAAGIRVGQRLTAISDSVRYQDMWPLEDRPSLKFVKDTLRMRRGGEVQMEFKGVVDEDTGTSAAVERIEGTPPETLPSLAGENSRLVARVEAQESLLDRVVEGEEVSRRGPTIAEMLQQRYSPENGNEIRLGLVDEEVKRQRTEVQQRIARRKDYLNQVGGRNDSGFLALMAAAFILPAMAILAVAYFTGYLDSLYATTMGLR